MRLPPLTTPDGAFTYLIAGIVGLATVIGLFVAAVYLGLLF